MAFNLCRWHPLIWKAGTRNKVKIQFKASKKMSVYSTAIKFVTVSRRKRNSKRDRLPRLLNRGRRDCCSRKGERGSINAVAV